MSKRRREERSWREGRGEDVEDFVFICMYIYTYVQLLVIQTLNTVEAHKSENSYPPSNAGLHVTPHHNSSWCAGHSVGCETISRCHAADAT